MLWPVVIISITHQRHFLHQHSQCVVELQYVHCLTLLQHRSSAGPNIMIRVSCYLSQTDFPESVFERGGMCCVFFRFLTRKSYHTDSVYFPALWFLQDPLIRGVHPHTGVCSERGEDPVLPGEEHQESGVVRFRHHVGVESYTQSS